LDLYAKSLSSDVEAIRPELAEAQFEAAWRSGQWDLSPEFLQGEITNNEAAKRDIMITIPGLILQYFLLHLMASFIRTYTLR
jgi:hypothetical protein